LTSIATEAIDVFNGDADGLLARHQYRLAHPINSVRLISGVKRDVKLLSQLSGISNAGVTVFDISLDSNAPHLEPIVADVSNRVLWFDHHRRGQIQDGERLETHIDLSPKTCTSLIVSHYLGGAHLPWAIAGAYGDNLSDVALPLGLESGLDEDECSSLRVLGEGLNYNGYGESREDLAVWPVDLALELDAYDCPFDFLARSPSMSKILEQKVADEKVMGEVEILHLSTSGEAVLLPRGGASRRMSGIFSNEKVYAEPDLAHATLTHLEDGSGYRISIRAPKSRPHGADVLASQFETGGGRAAAGGVNRLPSGKLSEFFEAFDEVFAC
jgi:hypothetical protein